MEYLFRSIITVSFPAITRYWAIKEGAVYEKENSFLMHGGCFAFGYATEYGIIC